MEIVFYLAALARRRCRLRRLVDRSRLCSLVSKSSPWRTGRWPPLPLPTAASVRPISILEYHWPDGIDAPAGPARAAAAATTAAFHSGRVRFTAHRPNLHPKNDMCSNHGNGLLTRGGRSGGQTVNQPPADGQSPKRRHRRGSSAPRGRRGAAAAAKGATATQRKTGAQSGPFPARPAPSRPCPAPVWSSLVIDPIRWPNGHIESDGVPRRSARRRRRHTDAMRG